MIKDFYGLITVDENWLVDEKKPIGYSRVYYVCGGDVLYEDKNCSFTLKSGYLYIFPSNLPYKMTHNVKNPLCCLYVHLDLFPNVVSRVIEVNVKNDKILSRLLDTIAATIEENNITILYSLIPVLEQYFIEKKLIEELILPITNALIYISKNYENDLPVATLAAAQGYNPCYFIKLFKKYTGVTPHQYIIDYRLKMSLDLLKEGVSITETARRTGYNDIKTFSLGFKEKFGISPKNFTRLNL